MNKNNVISIPKKSIYTIALLMTASIAKAQIPVATNLVANGDFQTNDLSSWRQTLASAGSDVFISPYTFGPKGENTLAFGAFSNLPDSIDQVINTIAGQIYTFSFLEYATFPAATDSGFAAQWNGVTVFQDTAYSSNQWVTVNLTETATANTTDIAFSGYNQQGYYFLTGVSLVANTDASGLSTGTSSLPLPGAVWMFLAGFLGFLGLQKHLRAPHTC